MVMETPPKMPQDASETIVILCLISQQTGLTFNPHREFMKYRLVEDETPEPPMQNLVAVIKATSRNPETDLLNATPQLCNNSCIKEALLIELNLQ